MSPCSLTARLWWPDSSTLGRSAITPSRLSTSSPWRCHQSSVVPVNCPAEGRPPTVIGTPGDDILVGTEGNDVVHGLEGNDTIIAQGGDDIICGGPGDDLVFGGPGGDAIEGGDGIR